MQISHYSPSTGILWRKLIAMAQAVEKNLKNNLLNKVEPITYRVHLCIVVWGKGFAARAR